VQIAICFTTCQIRAQRRFLLNATATKIWQCDSSKSRCCSSKSHADLISEISSKSHITVVVWHRRDLRLAAAASFAQLLFNTLFEQAQLCESHYQNPMLFPPFSCLDTLSELSSRMYSLRTWTMQPVAQTFISIEYIIFFLLSKCGTTCFERF
jgi:hypothetical protein